MGVPRFQVRPLMPGVLSALTRRCVPLLERTKRGSDASGVLVLRQMRSFTASSRRFVHDFARRTSSCWQAKPTGGRRADENRVRFCSAAIYISSIR